MPLSIAPNAADLYAAQAERQRAAAQSLRAAGGALTPETKAKIREKAQDFEAFYVYQLVELMKPPAGDTLFHGGMAEDMYRQTLNEELGKSVAARGGFGLADKVYTQLVHQQELQAAHQRAGQAK